MKDKWQEIEEIRNIVYFTACTPLLGFPKRNIEMYARGYRFDLIAQAIYDKGYRKESDTAKEILKWLKSLYAERQKEYTNWDGNKIKAVTTEWLNADIECIAEKYGVKID